VIVVNNTAGKDRLILKEFKEPAWNYQVIRFIDAEKKDLIPRLDGINTISGVARRMAASLKAAKRPVPEALKKLF